MNLEQLLVDPAKLRGIWWDLQTRRPCAGNQPHETHACVRVVPHSPAFDAALARAFEPYLAERLRGGSVPEDVQRRLRAQVMAEHVLVDWRNLQLGTPPTDVPYSRERATEFLSDPRWELVRRMVEGAFTSESALLQDAENQASGN